MHRSFAFPILLVAASAFAQVPPAALGKQILQNVALGSVRNELIGSLAGMGCKGPTLSALAATATGPRGGGIDPATMQAAMEMAQQQMAAQGRQLTPQQQALMQKAMQNMQTASAQPLSPLETTAVFDELRDLGLINDSLRKEANACISSAPPGSADAVGSAGAMLRSTVLPAARQAKARMATLTSEEQKQLTEGIVE